ncbi:putative cinnamyl alcohol dehydrogenase 4 [Drosera capensis]
MASETAIGEGNYLGWTARDPSGFLSPYKFDRRHVIAGIVQDVGANIKRFKVGDQVGVGTYINSCQKCDSCNIFLEVQCLRGENLTYNSVDVDGTTTQRGFSRFIVVHQRYTYKIPDNYPLELAAPLLCADITVCSPMKRHNMNQPGKSLGVIGLGGLGHMTVKFGLKVTVSTNISKKEEAVRLLGAYEFVLSSDEKQMKVAGVYVTVGASEVKFSPISQVLMGIHSHENSGWKRNWWDEDTQEMLDLCAAKGVYPKVEVIPIDYVDEALERLIKRDVKYRFVIDIENSLSSEHANLIYDKTSTVIQNVSYLKLSLTLE